MAGAFAAQLDDVLAQVGFNDLQPGRLEGMVEIDLLRDHGFRLGHQPGIVLPGDFEEDMDGFFCIGGAMNPDAIAGDLGDKAAEVFIQVGDHIRFDGVGAPAALLVIRDGGESLQPANRPALGVPIQGNLQVLVCQGLADAGAESLCAHRLSRTSAI